MQSMRDSRLSPVLPFLGILCLVAACGDDASDGGSKSGARIASDLHGTWTFDIDRMRKDASATGVGAEATAGAILLSMADLTVTFSDGWTSTSGGKRSKWKVTSMDGDTWTISHKEDGDDKWQLETLVWIDDDHVGVMEKDKDGEDGEFLYLKRKR